MEIWKDVIGFDGLYQVSSHGNIRNAKNKQCLKQSKQRNGYLYVTLRKNGNQYHSLMHRIVALSFIENETGHAEINHINEDKEDNRVSNLEWCDHRYNINYGTGHLRSAQKQGRKVRQLTLDGEIIKEYSSVREAARIMNRNHKDIYNVCNGYRKSSCGFKWEYVS